MFTIPQLDFTPIQFNPVRSLSRYLLQVLPSEARPSVGLILLGFRTKILYAFLVSPDCPMWLDLIPILTLVNSANPLHLTRSATQTVIRSWRGPVPCEMSQPIREGSCVHFLVLYSHSILLPRWKVQYVRSSASVCPIQKRVLIRRRENVFGKRDLKVCKRN
jgi:hypothetical protein